MFEVKYPENFYLWKTGILEKDKLQIIGDFPHQERILKAIGINNSPLVGSFGITDSGEINARRNLLWFLVENPEIREWIERAKTQFPLPQDKESYSSFYNSEEEHNPYWRQIHKLIELCDKLELAVIPERMGRLLDFFQYSFFIEEEERNVGKEVYEQIRKAARIEGLISFNYNGEIYDYTYEHIHGFYDFRFEKNWWQKLKNFCRRKGTGKRKTINTTTREMAEDIKDGFCEIAREIEEKLRQKKGDYYFLHNYRYRIHFLYDERGLRIRIYEAESYSEAVDCLYDTSYNDNASRYGNYSKKMIASINESEQKLKEIIIDSRRKMAGAEMLSYIATNDIGFFNHWFKIDSPQMDKNYKWVGLEEILYGKYEEVTKEAEKHRRFFENQITLLKKINHLAIMFCAIAARHNLPLCRPETVSNGHVIGFDALYPIYLLNKGKIKPISNLPKLNGNGIGMSGEHKAGKTTIGLTLIELIFLAQSGLLCFGENISLNIKKVLGLVFIPPGTDGSLCDSLLDQMTEILTRIKKTKNSGEFFVSLDELGGGTQNADGLEFGIRYIKTLLRNNISVYFNSQITELFRALEGDERIKCFKINRNHLITPGIGTGGFNKLIEEKGLDKLLVG